MTTLVVSPLGLLVGLMLGALGGGGSVLAVPMLVYIVGQTPQTATSTSLVIVALTAAAGLVGHHDAGHVRVGAGLALGVAGLGGSVAGSRLNTALPADVLLAAFALVMIAASVAMLRRAGGGRGPLSRAVSGGPAATATLTRVGERSRTGLAVRILVAGSGVGFLTGLFGVGGGFVVVPALVLGLGFPARVAVGTSLLVILLNTVTALVVRLLAGGAVDWAVAVPFSVAGLIGAVIGTIVSTRLEPDRLTRAFAGLLLVVAVAIVVDAVVT